MTPPLAQFEAVWSRCAQLSTLHAYLEKNVSGIMQPDELLRAEWVGRISALDLYIHELVAQTSGKKWKPRAPRVPQFVQSVGEADSFPNNSTAVMLPVKNGRVWIDTARWPDIRGFVETQSGGLIVDRGNVPFVTVPAEEFATKDSELLACSVESRLNGVEGFYLELEVPGLTELIGGVR